METKFLPARVVNMKIAMKLVRNSEYSNYDNFENLWELTQNGSTFCNTASHCWDILAQVLGILWKDTCNTFIIFVIVSVATKCNFSTFANRPFGGVYWLSKRWKNSRDLCPGVHVDTKSENVLDSMKAHDLCNPKNPFNLKRYW